MSIADEISRLQTAKADIKTAIENKGVTVPEEDTIDEYAQYIDDLSAGDVVNGVIRECLADSGTVDANTFVEFVNGIDDPVKSTLFTAGSDNYINIVHVEALSTSSAVVIYAEGADQNTRPLYARILEVASNGSVVAGTPVVVFSDHIYASSANTEGHSFAAVWSSTTFVVLNRVSNRLYCNVCSVSGQSITVGTTTEIEHSMSGPLRIFATITALNTTQAIVAYNTTTVVRVRALTRTSESSRTVMVSSDTSSGLSDAATLGMVRRSGNYAIVIATTGRSGAFSVKASSIYLSTSSSTPSSQTPYTFVESTSSIQPDIYPLASLGTNGGVLVVVSHIVYNLSTSSNGYRVVPVDTPTGLSGITGSTTNWGYMPLSGRLANGGGQRVVLNDYSQSTGTITYVGGTTSSSNFGFVQAVVPLVAPFTTSSSSTKALEIGKSSLSGVGASVSAAVFSTTPGTKIKASSTKIDGLTKTSATTESAGKVWTLN